MAGTSRLLTRVVWNPRVQTTKKNPDTLLDQTEVNGQFGDRHDQKHEMEGKMTGRTKRIGNRGDANNGCWYCLLGRLNLITR
jgi:hypothetical protein